MFDALSVKQRVVEWIREYFKQNAEPKTKAVIGISGGKDSSVVAALCAEALGKDRVFGVLMPQGEQHDIEVSYRLCKTLGIKYTVINIGEPVAAVYEEITGAGMALNEIAAVNTPARVRMTVLYAISGIVGGRVSNNSNLSEDWVGYATKFGDTAGDFSPLSDLTASEVKAIGNQTGLSAEFIEKAPTDGLCGKSDEERLGFSYTVLDRYIREGICADEEVKAKIDRLHELNRHKVVPMPSFRRGM
jgi:NAD+ synthase